MGFYVMNRWSTTKRVSGKRKFGSLRFGSIVAPSDRGIIRQTAVSLNSEQSSLSFFFQALLPFLFSGFGTVGAGILFDAAQSWNFFLSLPEAVVLVPALLGLKGNLEMTLGSRLSTQANLGKMNTSKDQIKLSTSNLSLVQAQAIFISLSAAIFTVIYETINSDKWKHDNYLLLCLTSVSTASITSLLLGIFMIAIVLLSLHIRVNPDNITTPIAASLGDIITLLCMICFGSVLLKLDSHIAFSIVLLILWILFAVFCIWLASKNVNTKSVLKYGWYAIIVAMLISSGSGMILQKAVKTFPNIVPFQPVINGVGGNLAAIQASRFSTYLHKTFETGVLPNGTIRRSLNPFRAFFSNDSDARTARVLLLMVMPGHLIFLALTFAVVPSTFVSTVFVLAYLIVSIVQVVLLLYLCQIMVPVMWRYRVDPDNSAIPILTAIGDLLGITLFYIVLLSCRRMLIYSPLYINPTSTTIVDNDISNATAAITA
uniref:Divalent cation transporter n=1 Tax=Syphacia muris TaxID=451379 RepID=A0A0N5AP28_9BILA